MSTEWFYLKRTGNGYIVFETADKPICAVNDEEHARMIAAAPEMLEALERILPAAIAREEPDSYDQHGDIAFAEAAIAKAKGGTAMSDLIEGYPSQSISTSKPYAEPKRWRLNWDEKARGWKLVYGLENKSFFLSFLSSHDRHVAIKILDIYNEMMP